MGRRSKSHLTKNNPKAQFEAAEKIYIQSCKGGCMGFQVKHIYSAEHLWDDTVQCSKNVDVPSTHSSTIHVKHSMVGEYFAWCMLYGAILYSAVAVEHRAWQGIHVISVNQFYSSLTTLTGHSPPRTLQCIILSNLRSIIFLWILLVLNLIASRFSRIKASVHRL